MEANTIHALLNIALLQAIIFLFVYIKYFISGLAKGMKKTKLEENEIVICIIAAFLVFFVIVNETTALDVKYLFFVLAVGIHAGSCLLINRQQRKPMIYPKSFLIFHNGSFLKGAILQNKLTEKEIMKSLTLMGVDNLSDVDTIILEPDGELSVILKKKAKSTI